MLQKMRTTSKPAFPAPWRIVEIPNGFAVDDATGRQLGVFYGRADPNIAGHTGFLTIDEARQMAVNFAKLPELLNWTSGRSEPAPSLLQRESSSRRRAQTQNGRHTTAQLERLGAKLATRPINPRLPSVRRP
jgi:hypothetical protein